MNRLIFLSLIIFSIFGEIIAQDFELIPYRKGNKWGFSDSTLNIKILPKYEFVIPFNVGYAAFKKENKWGFLNIAGNEILPPTYDSIQNYFNYVDVYENGKSDSKIGITVITDGKKQVVDIHGNNLEIGELAVAGGMDNNSAKYKIFKKNDLYGLKDYSSKVLIEPIYEEIRFDEYCFIFLGKLKNKWGAFNNSFEKLVDNIYDSIKYVYPGLMIVELNNKFGVINYENKIIIPLNYKGIVRTEVVSGFYVVDNKNRKGYINDKGEIILQPIYDNIKKHSYYEESFSVQVKDKWGYRDDKKNIHIKPKYKDIKQFVNGYAFVADLNGHIGYINKNGIEFFKE